MMRIILLLAMLVGSYCVVAEPASRGQGVAVTVAALDTSRALDPSIINLRSAAVLVYDAESGEALVARNANSAKPIASITKLMTAIVALDAKQGLDQVIAVTNDDIDRLKGTSSRLRVGAQLTRRQMLHLALMSSENRAASALAGSYPGGRAAFITAMNRKAAALGMKNTRFHDSTGLSARNVSTAQDLMRLVLAAKRYPLIRQFSTTPGEMVTVKGSGRLQYKNSNRLVQTRNKDWRIGLSKTGYTAEAGRCLVMEAQIGGRPLVFVLLNSWGKLTPIGDANRIRRWVETSAKGRTRRLG
jgi:D-alanyl-D-alanine endopeptidase (penicillin-binding protein 7)